jgi:hypothetical protein
VPSRPSHLISVKTIASDGEPEMKQNESHLRKMMIEQDSISFENRLARLRFLMGVLSDESMPISRIVMEYFEETKFCFYEGAYVATILMASATLEEMIRQLYRDSNQMEKANAFGLAKISRLALEDNLISNDEYKRLDDLRKLRNKFTHLSIGFDESDIKNKKTYSDFALFWEGSHKPELPIEQLAEEAIKILAELVPRFCFRFSGL